MKPIHSIAIALFVGAAIAPAMANQHASAAPAVKNSVADSAAKLSDGEIRKIDKENGKVTIKHGPLHSLDMPAMTMVFKAKDPAMLDNVKVGDAIRFKAEKIDGAFTVTQYQAKK